jgi:uridine phosphorylase
MKRMMHVGLLEGDIAPLVLLPGSPERAVAIASHLQYVEEKAYNREYRTFTGIFAGQPISICSTGIGGPSIAIAVEELVQLGATKLVRVGTCLSTNPSVTRGSLVLPQAAVRMEGVGEQYLPPEFPAVADMDLLSYWEAAAVESPYGLHIGTCITRSSYYIPFDGIHSPVGFRLQEVWKSYIRGGALCSDMDTAILFIVAESLGVAGASILVCTNNHDTPLSRLEDDPEDCEQRVIEVTLEAVRRMADG